MVMLAALAMEIDADSGSFPLNPTMRRVTDFKVLRINFFVMRSEIHLTPQNGDDQKRRPCSRRSSAVRP